MQISPASYYNYSRYNLNRVNNTPKVATNVNNHASKANLSFTATNEDFNIPYYGVYIEVDRSKFDPLNASKNDLYLYGQILRTTPDDVIKDKFCFVPKWNGFRHDKKSEEAYQRLAPYVEIARMEYERVCKDIEIGEELKAQDDGRFKQEKEEKKEYLDELARTAMNYTKRVYVD